MVLLGGGPADPVLVGRAGDAGLKILRTYGMTETTSQVATAREPGGPMFPLPGVDVAIGPEGRIEITGPIVMTGYIGEPDLGGGFLTADYGVIDSDGSLEVLGRADRVIITGGEKVNPEAIESLVTGHPGVIEVVVIGIPDSEWGERLVAVFVGDVDSSDLHNFLRTSVPAYSLPKQWVQVESLPRTDLGKVDAAAVRRLFSTASGS
jgi:O-succinylbenzoic acid--CoA ligase